LLSTWHSLLLYAPAVIATTFMKGLIKGLRVSAVLPLVALNTVVHCMPLFVVALGKALLPFAPLRRVSNDCLARLAESWIGVNNAMIHAFTPTRFVAELPDDLRQDGHYLVLANHQSWVDILVLQKLLNRRIPLLRFFLKRSLIWVPILGLAWWALDFPFIRRYSRQQLAKNPQLRLHNRLVTRRSCEKFADIPVSIMNFVEGTRFTARKHATQASPWPHLLKPHAGGIAFVLDAMGSGLHALLDVSIVYPAGIPSMMDLMAGRIPEVRVHIRPRPLPLALIQTMNDPNDRAFRVQFKRWLNELWDEKQATIAQMRQASTQ